MPEVPALAPAFLHRAARALRRAGGAALGLALPPTCLACGAVTGMAGGLCGSCWGGLAFISRPYCERTGAPFAFDTGAPQVSPEALDHPPAFDRARAAVLFTDVARDLVHGLKYADRLDYARPMARMMAQAGRELLDEADLVLPVPLHPVRLWQRRFNQAALLARHLSAHHAATRAAAEGRRIAVRTDLLRRRRATPSQTDLGRAERHANVAGAFAMASGAEAALSGRWVLIVDDVFTTGATLDACARTVRRAGAARVDVLTFARVVEFA